MGPAHGPVGERSHRAHHPARRGELALYLLLYVVLTLAAFRRVPAARTRAWAAATRPGSWVRRYVLATEPGAGLATMASALALLAVYLLPRAGGDAPAELPVVLSVVLIVASWLSVALSFAVDYLCRDQRGPGSLEFPGTPEPEWTDYLYFAVGVSTTFGTTDTGVRTSPMRRTVTTHAVLAFVFNTVILA